MDPDRRKTVTITVLVVLVLGAALGYYYVQRSSPGVRPPTGAVQNALPSIGEAANPLSNKPDLNPASKTNPFDSVKTNPFD